MGGGGLQGIVAGFGRRRVVVLSDRYPPDTAGGAEVSLHLLLREPALREQSLVVTFDKLLAAPERRELDGVDVLALPANAAWPLHRLSQDEVERLKRRGAIKWAAFLAEAARCVAHNPAIHAPALALKAFGAPPGGVRMAHATVPEGRVQDEIRTVLDIVRPTLVHADNARSIMMAADVLATREVPLVALVRDHRFTSFRFDQTLAPLNPRALSIRERLAARCARAALAFRQKCLKRADAVIATSAHLAETLSTVAPSGRLRRLPLEPVELPAHQLKDADGAFSVLIVGSLSNNKGQAHLLAAWPDLVRRIPNLVLHIAGQGSARAEIERLIARHGAGDRVRLHGHVSGETLAALYRDCDLVALPTLWSEPFGRVPLEAGAAGRPVVAYASGGLAENVIDGVTGRLAPTGDRNAFIEAIADLAADAEARERMGEAGRARVVDAYAPARLARMLGEVWEEMASPAGAGRMAGPA